MKDRRRLSIPVLADAEIELPAEVKKLYSLAYNLWWAWSPRARALFHAIDDEAWSMYHNPVQVLLSVDPHRWEMLLNSDSFMSRYTSVVQEFERYMRGSGWFGSEHGAPPGGPVAYFSMEYGLHECLPLYSGGLGILSGDHMKSASDLGVPFVGLGLMYRRGYFHQTLDADGRQQHIYPQYDPTRLPIRPVRGHTQNALVVGVDFPDRTVFAQVWLAQIGRVPLLLLDTDVPRNDPADRPISHILYVRGREMRLAQELLLGMGGVRALRALDIEPAVWHMNEGHSALLQLERTAEEVGRGADFEAALANVSANSVFTTHTPVAAGNETFDVGLAQRYVEPWCGKMGVPVERILEMARSDDSGSFNMTALALRTSRVRNGVSELHAQVSNDMWSHILSEGGSVDPIVAITNGVHMPTWLGMEMIELLDRRLGVDWMSRLMSGEPLNEIDAIPDEEIWAAHQAQKQRLGRRLRGRLREQFARHGRAPDALRALESQFDPEALTVGFARRFATYKRAGLVFRELERLRSLVVDPERPVQILLAGKAHPADHPGQDLITNIFQLSQSDGLRGRVFFVEDYDMDVGRALVQGCDVWLNNPRRPMEASGTSGQKSAANGGLNLSVSDGWWPEGYDGENGWIVGDPEAESADEEAQDAADAASLYALLTDDVVPEFYSRDEDGLPRAWIRRMKRAMATVAPRFSSDRMVREYVERAYLPVAPVRS